MAKIFTIVMTQETWLSYIGTELEQHGFTQATDPATLRQLYSRHTELLRLAWEQTYSPAQTAGLIASAEK